ncbi:FAD-dependent oxidoreductase [Empedobacter brevis]|uniref:FAD-dependent oxidoreductase n=1 Tax=Empedobacter brevis TaxID=247 RepID=UPI0039B104B2
MNTRVNWISCKSCNGLGKKSQGVSKRKLIRYKSSITQSKKIENSTIPTKPKSSMQICTICSGTGLMTTNELPLPNEKKYPHIAIVGAGIGGIALALACLHRQIPFTLFERDRTFNDRSQGYGLTLQQASKELKKFGIQSLDEGIVSTLHLAHKIDGNVIGEWGIRKLQNKEAIEAKNKNKFTNIHIARQSLRLAFLNQLGGDNQVLWNHQLIDYKINDKIELTFNVNGIQQKFETDLLVGADGIRSTVRRLIIDENKSPLRYLGCIVILGICKLDDLENVESHLLDGATVFQTANGTERMYMMPYDKDSLMWQFSFPLSEEEAIVLSKKGSNALKTEVTKRTNWHSPIPEIIASTKAELITGYPVYDRDLLTPDLLQNVGPVTLIGDAAHPMSPFKGQGANQALLDALLFAQKITSAYNGQNEEINLRKDILESYEKEMMERSSVKVKKSADAAKFLHSNIVLQEGNVTFGSKWSSSL